MSSTSNFTGLPNLRENVKVLLLENIHQSAHERFHGGSFQIESRSGALKEDELIEVTPQNIRLRKRVLRANDGKKAARAARVADAS